MRIVHHDLALGASPDSGDISATDHLYLAGDGAELKLYLGSAFRIREARQGAKRLSVESIAEQRRQHRYLLRGFDPADPAVTVEWDGHVGNFEVSSVCTVTPTVVELSGFGSWFPTIEPSNEEELFSYCLDIDLPASWDVITPGISDDGDTQKRRFTHHRPIEDIFICASPQFVCYETLAGNQRLRVFSAGLTETTVAAIAADYQRAVSTISKYLGPMLPGRGGAVVISPRGEAGAEWGFERGDLWVVGDALAKMLVDANWHPVFLPGPASLSMHESIHAWLGLGLHFEQAWLAESSTQYLELVLSEEVFGQPGNALAFFSSYLPRICKALARDDRPIAALTHADSNYEHWYLKGSWAFWDLEAVVGREALIAAIATIYRRHAASSIDYCTYVAEMSELLGQPLADHFDHWFRQSGFAPRYRT